MYNPVLIAGIISWFLAQFLKMPIEYRRSHRWDWSLLMRAGGMPSSHSALVSSITYGVGLSMGLDSPVFALAAAVAAVVIYDATGIRRQAGKHAAVINAIIADLASGHPLKEEQLREVLGHTPLQALVGTLMGFLVAQIVWWILP
jgi:acid phosphatase family membrane protein YuiD